MIRILLCSTALIVAAPAMAQDTAAPSPQQQPDATAPQPSASGAAATPSAPAHEASPANAVATIVESEFPTYDADGSGELDKAEFSRWMVALKGEEMKATGKALPADQVMAWAGGAFTTADADKSTAVSKPELVSYLSGGAG